MKIKHFIVTVVFVGFVVTGLSSYAAEEKPLTIHSSDSIQSVLKRHIGRRVELLLDSGKSLTGTVKQVEVGVVHITQLAGKEFFDAVVRTDRVSALVIRVKKS